MGCGCGRAKRAAARAAMATLSPEDQAIAAPFTFLAGLGWRPAGQGLWTRGEEQMTAAEAIARELVAAVAEADAKAEEEEVIDVADAQAV